jgi:hypothetical protein
MRMGWLNKLKHVLVGDRQVSAWMWSVPALGAVACAAMVWLVMVAVPWFIKAPVCAIVLLYTGIQSALYLADDEHSSDPDEGGRDAVPAPRPQPPIRVIRVEGWPESREPAEEKELEAPVR